MSQGIHGQFPATFKLAYELRYRFGFTYLDRCGRILNMIERESPDWILPPAGPGPTPQGTVLVNVKTSSRFSFSSNRLDLGLQKPMSDTSISLDDVKEFAEQAEQLTSLLVDQLSLDDFSRIGCRIWHLFPFSDPATARNWMSGLKCYSISPGIETAFEGKIEDVSLGVSLIATDRKFRIGFDFVERTVAMDLGDAVLNVPVHSLESSKANRRARLDALVQQQKVRKRLEQNLPYGVMIDVDASQDEPEVLNIAEFIRSSFELGYDRLRKAVG